MSPARDLSPILERKKLLHLFFSFLSLSAEKPPPSCKRHKAQNDKLQTHFIFREEQLPSRSRRTPIKQRQEKEFFLQIKINLRQRFLGKQTRRSNFAKETVYTENNLCGKKQVGKKGVLKFSQYLKPTPELEFPFFFYFPLFFARSQTTLPGMEMVSRRRGIKAVSPQGKLRIPAHAIPEKKKRKFKNFATVFLISPLIYGAEPMYCVVERQ